MAGRSIWSRVFAAGGRDTPDNRFAHCILMRKCARPLRDWPCPAKVEGSRRPLSGSRPKSRKVRPMAAPANSTEFLDLVRKSGVTDEKRLDVHLGRLRGTGGLPADPVKVAQVLVRDGVLTHFQAEQILQGKWRR